MPTEKVRKLFLPAWYLPKGTINAAENRLEDASSSCERWEWGCAGLVVLAVIAEIVLASVHPSYDSPWNRWGSALADAAIAVGIVGEVIFGRLDAKIQTELRKRSNEKLAEANERAAEANLKVAALQHETASLTADNLTLQAVLAPRHAGLFGIDQEPPAKKWFSGFERWNSTKILIQVVPGDAEAQNLANEIAIVLSRFGWRPEMIDEKRSGISLHMSEGVSVFSPSSYKPWDPDDPVQQKFATLGQAARALALALTHAGLGIGNNPVSGVYGLIIEVDFPPGSDAGKTAYGKFNPSLDGVYLQVGSRPVSLTLQLMARRRAAAGAAAKTAPATNR